MRVKSIFVVLVTVLLLTACAAPSGTPTVVITEAPFIPAPTSANTQAYPNPPAGAPTTNPYPATAGTPTASHAYPGPGTPVAGGYTIPASGFEPQAADSSLKRDVVTLDLTASLVVVTVGEPAQAQAILKGSMSDPCHALRVVVTPADANHTISLEAYSVVDTRTACTTVIQPFSAPIPLGSYASGEYKVTVNDSPLGQFATLFSPQPGDTALTRADLSPDMSLSKLVSLVHPNGEAAYLQGSLPDPCHQLRIVVNPPDTQNQINLEVYSVYDPGKICTTVIVPFAVNVPLGNNPAGHYTVNVNGTLLGEFNQ